MPCTTSSRSKSSVGPSRIHIPRLRLNPKTRLKLSRSCPSHQTSTPWSSTAFYSSSWQQMFRLRPRIRFNGCYISTNNYIRPGQAAPSHVTWSSPVHIVTYYRYLRFFRDGTVISLLTTTEPAEVVHHLTPELMSTHQQGANAHLPSAVMQHALRGRWRLIPRASTRTESRATCAWRLRGVERSTCTSRTCRYGCGQGSAEQQAGVERVLVL